MPTTRLSRPGDDGGLISRVELGSSPRAANATMLFNGSMSACQAGGTGSAGDRVLFHREAGIEMPDGTVLLRESDIQAKQ